MKLQQALNLISEAACSTMCIQTITAESTIFLVVRVCAKKFIGALFPKDCSCRTRILELLQANVGRRLRVLKKFQPIDSIQKSQNAKDTLNVVPLPTSLT
jgi:hypothetical protein